MQLLDELPMIFGMATNIYVLYQVIGADMFPLLCNRLYYCITIYYIEAWCFFKKKYCTIISSGE